MPCFWFFARQSCYELRFCANVRETSKRTKSQWHGTRQSYRELKIFQTIGRKKRRCIVYAIRHSLRGDCGKSGPFSCKCPRISLETDLAVSCEERRRCFDPRYDRNYIDRVDVSLRLLHRYTRVLLPSLREKFLQTQHCLFRGVFNFHRSNSSRISVESGSRDSPIDKELFIASHAVKSATLPLSLSLSMKDKSSPAGTFTKINLLFPWSRRNHRRRTTIIPRTTRRARSSYRSLYPRSQGKP